MADPQVNETHEIIDALKADFGEILNAYPAIKERQDALAAENEELKKTAKRQDDAITDLIARVERGQKLTQETNLRVEPGTNRIMPTASPKLCEFAGKVWRGRMTEIEARELGSTTGANGGFLFQQEFIPELIQLIYSYGAFRQNATVLSMPAPTLVFPSLASGVSVYWIDENQPGTEANPTFAQVSMTAKTLVALTHASSQLLEDSQINLGQLLVELFTRQIAFEEDTQGFNGVGAPFTGAMRETGINTVAMTTGNVAFNNVNADLLNDMTSVLPTPLLQGAKFYMHRTVLEIVRKQKDSIGNYIFQPATAGYPGTIWGWPFELVEAMPAASASAPDTPFILFGNLKNVFLGDRHELEAARSNEVGFTKLQTFLRLHERISIKVAQPKAFSVCKTAAS